MGNSISFFLRPFKLCSFRRWVNAQPTSLTGRRERPLLLPYSGFPCQYAKECKFSVYLQEEGARTLPLTLQLLTQANVRFLSYLHSWGVPFRDTLCNFYWHSIEEADAYQNMDKHIFQALLTLGSSGCRSSSASRVITSSGGQT